MTPNPRLGWPGYIVVALLLGGVLFALLTACGATAAAPWDGRGVVTALRFDDEDRWTERGSCAYKDEDSGLCLFYNQVQRYDPPHWWVQVTSEDGREHHVEVTEVEYGRCRVGAIWTNGRCPS